MMKTTLEQEWPIAKADQGAWPSFRERVCKQFTPFVWKNAGTWFRRGKGFKLGTIEDCVQVGFFALLRAIDYFDPTRGVKFITYATTTVRTCLSRVTDEAELIRVPSNVHKCMRKGEVNYLTECAERTRNLWSLDKRVCDSDEGRAIYMRDLIEAREEPEEPKEEWGLTAQALQFLSDREREVLRRRFFRNETLEETGVALGISKERVRQIEAQAIAQLRTMLVSVCSESSE